MLKNLIMINNDLFETQGILSKAHLKWFRMILEKDD